MPSEGEIRSHLKYRNAPEWNRPYAEFIPSRKKDDLLWVYFGQYYNTFVSVSPLDNKLNLSIGRFTIERIWKNDEYNLRINWRKSERVYR